MSSPDLLRHAWKNCWADALRLWTPFSRLSPPRWCLSDAEAIREGLDGSFAMIRLSDHAVVINLQEIDRLRLGDFGLEILAHEIGHHIFCPANLEDHARCLIRIRRGLPTAEAFAPSIANLYTDLLINDSLQRSHRLAFDKLYQSLPRREPMSLLWRFYLRIYEILWALPSATLCPEPLPPSSEVDAALGARLVRAYRADWLAGAGGFALLCLPYLLEDSEWIEEPSGRTLADLSGATGGTIPEGLTEIEADEDAACHPAEDPRVTGKDAADDPSATDPGSEDASPGKHPAPSRQEPSRGQHREPLAFGEILKGLGITLSPAETAVRYYRERARPHLILFPEAPRPASHSTQLEGFEPWEMGDPAESIDWFQSTLRSAEIIPGYTTVEPVLGTAEDLERARAPFDLDLYVDASGSMPNPQTQLSFLALAGAILSLSALRAGARVQATLWSGPGQFRTTGGFLRDETAILEIITGSIGGSTTFPLHLVRETYLERVPPVKQSQLMILSDEGVDTMYLKDEKGTPGEQIMAEALARSVGGTLALNLHRPPGTYAPLQKAAGQGWDIHAVTNWEELVHFAESFSRRRYGEAAR